MKHSLKITLIIVALFFISQLLGLVTINKHIAVSKDAQTGQITIDHPSTVLGPPAEVQHKSTSFLMIGVFILIGTILLLVLIKYRVYKVWKLWFFIAVWLTMAVTIGIYIDWIVSVALAFGLALWKLYRPNVYLYNITEIMIYTGIVILLLPILNIYSAFGLLIMISLYDMYAVWKSKHMIKMAKFQTKTNVFAGLLIPYSDSGAISRKQKAKGAKKVRVKNAILGGGDVAFPLIFSAVVMEYLIQADGLSKSYALGLTGIISVITSIFLLGLMLFAKEDKFYPAMPFISAGCFLGYLVVALIV